MKNKTMEMLVLGDIILGADAPKYMAGIKDRLMAADFVAGQLEVPYSDCAQELAGLDRETKNLKPLAGCMDLVTLAGNHIYDAKETGVKETIAWLKAHGILYAGGGMNTEDARKPAVAVCKDVKIGFLNYNCTGPSGMTALKDKAGCAALDIITHYDLGNVANPGGPPEHIYTFPKWESLKEMCRDIAGLRTECDVLCVYFHKGIVHKPVQLADYEQIVSYAAIEAGADIIYSSHSHLLHGIEIYKGKTIYHGLGNGVTWVPSLRPDYKFSNRQKSNELFDPQTWAKRRIERFGFVPDPSYPTYPFHPEAVYTIIAKCLITDKQIIETRCIPAIVGQDGITRLVSKENGGQQVFDYLAMITKQAGLNACYGWDGDEIVIFYEKENGNATCKS